MRHGGIGREGRAAERREIDVNLDVPEDTELARHAPGRLDFEGVPLPVAHGQRVEAVAGLAGDGGRGIRIEAAAQQDDGGLHTPRTSGPQMYLCTWSCTRTGRRSASTHAASSELFGHEKGAFTGAAERRLGRFELADTGTIFLDEIGEIPSSVQVKLLRVLETRSFFRVGGVQPIKVDVRVVAATNRPLKDRVARGDFRDDLFYRLNVLSIYLPPLRERRDDVPLLIKRFVREFTMQHDRTFPGIAADAMELLVDAPWPGNVRQLRNLIESMVVLAPGKEIRASDIPADVMDGAGTLLPMRIGPQALSEHPLGGAEFEFILRSLMELRSQLEGLRRRLDQQQEAHVIEVINPDAVPLRVAPVAPVGPDREEAEPEPEPVVVYRSGMTMAAIERAAIETVLREHGGNRRKAAQVLGIGERTLYRKLKEYEIG